MSFYDPGAPGHGSTVVVEPWQNQMTSPEWSAYRRLLEEQLIRMGFRTEHCHDADYVIRMDFGAGVERFRAPEVSSGPLVPITPIQEYDEESGIITFEPWTPPDAEVDALYRSDEFDGVIEVHFFKTGQWTSSAMVRVGMVRVTVTDAGLEPAASVPTMIRVAFKHWPGENGKVYSFRVPLE